MTALVLSPASVRLLERCVDRCHAPRLRTHAQFVRDELVIPEGKYEGEAYCPETQPWTGLWLEALDSGRWNRAALLGCVQGGKSLFGQAEPALKHLFDGPGERVIFSAKTVDDAKGKYRKELLPVIRSSPRLRAFLPDEGAGSRGGIPEQIHFKNGTVLIFMSGSGGDASRSSETSRVLLATEVDKYDTSSEGSRETAPIRQLEARLLSYDEDERQAYMECTVSIEQGVIWQEYLSGTQSRIVCRCPGCRRWLTPEREQLSGWQDAETKQEARDEACWVCPECGVIWDDADRREMNRGAKLVHRGQAIDEEGVITGEPAPTDTLGFRFNAFNNMFWSTAAIAAAEWEAARDVDEDSAERRMRQFYWAIPYQPPEVDLVPLDSKILKRRTLRLCPRGLCPEGTEYLTVGMDMGKWMGWWLAVAWYPGPRAHVVDYGALEIPSGSMGVELAMQSALREFRERVEETGWLQQDGTRRVPDQVWIDARYQGGKSTATPILDFCRLAGARWRPAMGFGFGQEHAQWYNRPKSTGATVKLIGDDFHIEWSGKDRVHVVQVNSDAWKSFAHERLAVPFDPLAHQEIPVGAMTLYASPDANEHTTLIKHLTAERAQEEIIPGKGPVTKWIHEGRRANHYLDTLYLACASGNLCGVRIGVEKPVAVARPVAREVGTSGLGPGWRPRGFRR